MYVISRKDDVRMIEVPKRDLHRFRFYGPDRTPIQWDSSLSDKSNVRVIVRMEVQVYRKPNPSVWHYEFLRNSRLRLNGWSKLTDEELLENMLDLLEKV